MVVEEKLEELLRALKNVIEKHQTLNSVEILSAAGTVIAKVRGQYLRETCKTLFILAEKFSLFSVYKAGSNTASGINKTSVH